MTINRAGETSTSLLIRKEDASPPILADGRGEAIPEMANVTRYKTTKGETRYRVRYRKPDGTQTDKRGFRRKIDAENWAAEHVTMPKQPTATWIRKAANDASETSTSSG